ncbi:urea carboxylase-associated family protein [Mycolicibacterium sp. 624]|uniref:urea carboxylase-associated family protein n=1 Tax=Mycolicibacterium sp. 624 TaxID=3156314 RepID=UPI0033937156
MNQRQRDWDRRLTVLAGCGASIDVQLGDIVRIVNTSGTQVVDFWAFVDGEHEYLSMEHNREVLQRLFFRPGDVLVTNRYRPILSFLADTSPGLHDTLIAACSAAMYRQHGAAADHRSCQSNLNDALGYEITRPPNPWNLFMVAGIDDSGEIGYRRCDCVPGSFVDVQAEMDLSIFVSACPDDVYPTNGGDGQPRDVDILIMSSA